MIEMTSKSLKDICKSLNLYQTAELNDKIYLHYKGWKSINICISEYNNLKCIYLEGNGLRHIENLQDLKELKCLYIQENLIEYIESNSLSENIQLYTLNLNQNMLRSIQHISHLKKLNTLLCSQNKLATYQDLQELRDCHSISVLDLSKNFIEDPDLVDTVFAKMQSLRVLYLKDNPICQKIKSYRKILISKCRSLTYLDDRPISDDERRCIDAWKEGGLDAERAMNAQIQQEKREKEERQFDLFTNMIHQARRERLALEVQQGTPRIEQSLDQCNSTDDDSMSTKSDVTEDSLSSLSNTTEEHLSPHPNQQQQISASSFSSETSEIDSPTAAESQEDSLSIHSHSNSASSEIQTEQISDGNERNDALVTASEFASQSPQLRNRASRNSSVSSVPGAVIYKNTQEIDPILLDRQVNHDDLLVQNNVNYEDNLIDAMFASSTNTSACCQDKTKNDTIANKQNDKKKIINAWQETHPTDDKLSNEFETPTVTQQTHAVNQSNVPEDEANSADQQSEPVIQTQTNTANQQDNHVDELFAETQESCFSELD